LQLLAARWELGGLSRRDFLRLTMRGVSTASIAGILAACGGSPAATVVPSVAPSAVPSVAPSTAASAAPSVAPSVATRTGAAGAATPGGSAPVSGAVPTTNPNAPKGGTLTSAAVGDIRSYHPFQTSDTASSGAQGLIYGGPS
jgi:hypothetical protein